MIANFLPQLTLLPQQLDQLAIARTRGHLFGAVNGGSVFMTQHYSCNLERGGEN